MSEATAERIVTEALKYVAAAAKFPTVPIQPSKVVDEGWHALILHTRLYARLCEGLGHFVNHFPERPGPERHDPNVLTRTVALLEQAGFTVDAELWTGPIKPWWV
ncbi:glycine-rich domain-containing protein [Streptomyces sp. NPDC006711]|uniref:glycine-rich domain-containing protein n=1 Tax=Streptomyces sp. NPDC006711 TaxID=3364762 RepID=UPI00369B70D3